MRPEVRHDTEPAVTVHCQESPSKRAKKQTAAELASLQVVAAAEDGWRLVYVDGLSKPLWKGSKYRAGGDWNLLTRGHANRENQHIGAATAGPPANQ